MMVERGFPRSRLPDLFAGTQAQRPEPQRLSSPNDAVFNDCHLDSCLSSENITIGRNIQPHPSS
jgi:hypothetical protein